MSFGQHLRDLRRDIDLSQAELADRVGCSVNTVRKLESDERRPSRELALNLAAVLNLPQRERAEFVRFARGAGAAGRASLPVPPTRLIGREQDLAAVSLQLLSPEARLLTLVGPPGVGKTRLAIQAARDVQPDMRDGAAFVALAAVRDPLLVAESIAQTLGVRATTARSLDDALVEHLAERELLLVLDNFEQVLPARTTVSRLLADAPRLRLLVSSREVLDLYGERVYAVAPLALTPLPRRTSREAERSPAELLLLERARAMRPSFASAAAEQPIVAEVCRRLEGLPLALELAASRARTLSPRSMLEGLSSKLDLLEAGPADFSPRQQSMRGALAWSYDLLQAQEQLLFRRCAVFAGGATREAIVAICTDASLTEASVRVRLDALVDKSLLEVSDRAGAMRFGMLEVVREYAFERLKDAGSTAELEHLRATHAAFFADQAFAAQARLRGPQQVEWLHCLEADEANLRAALEWSVDQRHGEWAGRLCAGLWPFWRARGRVHEGRRWLAASLALGGLIPAALRAAMLNGAGVLSVMQADYPAASVQLTDSRDQYAMLGDRFGVAFATSNLGWLARNRKQTDLAQQLFEDSLRLRREIDDRWGEAWTLSNLGVVAIDRGDLKAARALLDESVRLFRDVGDHGGSVQALSNLGWVVQAAGDYAHASQLFDEALGGARHLDDPVGIANNVSNLALMALYLADYGRAGDLFQVSLQAYQEIGDRRGVAGSLESLAGVAAVEGRPEHAARLFGAAAALREHIGAPLLAADASRYEPTLASAREALDDAAWSRAWTEGRSTPIEALLSELAR